MVTSTTSDEEEEDHHRFDYEELATATGSFSPHNLIGRGSHGSVYKAFLNLPTNHVQIVAVKKPTSGLETQVGHDNSRKLENEIQTLSSLKGRRRHIVTMMSSPYIINFLGASHCNSNSLDKKKENGQLLLVTEFLPNGSLEDLLHSKKEVTHLSTTRHNIPWAQRVEIIVQLAKAVEFLHQGCVIHRDLKPSNILFDSSWTPKLADFGLAVSASHDDDDHQQPAAGTIGYMDPSYTSPSKLTTKVDVYSFGVVVLEVISGRKAMDVTRSPASVVDWAMGLIGKQRAMEICDRRSSSGLPPVFMEGTVEKLLYVAARCVSMSPDDRPSMAEIVAGLGGGGGPVRDQYRVRLPSWVDLVRRNLKRVRKKRKVVVKCDGQRDVSKGKLLLWELLADITLT